MADAATLAAGCPAPAALAFGVLALASLLGIALPERVVARIALAAGLAGLLLALATAAAALRAPAHRAIATWYVADGHPFPIEVLADRATAAYGLAAAVLLLVGLRFTAIYLHRDPGYTRFVALLLLFGVAVQAIAVAGSVDTLFFGWELAGLCSTLLVAFFHDRERPVRNALRVFVTYRVCDLGVLVAAVLLAHHAGTTAFPPLGAAAPPLPSPVGAAVGLLLLLGAAGKAAQVPVSGWLPRAMEGPTPSSALFYAGLSVHAGAFLLIRGFPFLADAPAVRALVVVVGLATAFVAGTCARVAPDAKGALAWAAAAQSGLVFAEIGAGLLELALLHLVAHLLLRTAQLLRTPGVVQDADALAGHLGRRPTPRASLPLALYAPALQGFHLDALLDRGLVAPVLAVAGALDRAERRVERWLVGDG